MAKKNDDAATEIFSEWLSRNMSQGNRDVPGRLLTLLGLMERLREISELSKETHLASSGNQLEEHNAFVEKGLKRFEIVTPRKEYGRRSSNLHAWIGSFFELLRVAGFSELNEEGRQGLLQGLGQIAARRLQIINEDKPLIARLSLGTASAVICDILEQAQAKNRAKDVAEYLVGAKLQLRFGSDAVQPKNVNTPNLDGLADFRIGSTALEVTVSPSDKRHVDQIGVILDKTGLDVWLLVRQANREKWQTNIDFEFKKDGRSNRIAVVDLESMLGGNVTEIGKFEKADIIETLKELFVIYNDKWLPAAGSSGLRIESGDPSDE